MSDQESLHLYEFLFKQIPQDLANKYASFLFNAKEATYSEDISREKLQHGFNQLEENLKILNNEKLNNLDLIKDLINELNKKYIIKNELIESEIEKALLEELLLLTYILESIIMVTKELNSIKSRMLILLTTFL